MSLTLNLIWLPVTAIVYLAADRLQQRTGQLVLQPMLTSLLVLVLLVLASGQSADAYLQGTRLLVWVAGPLTVGMALPLFRERRRILDHWRPLLWVIGSGSIVGVVSAFALAHALYLGGPVERAFLTRAISLPFALPVSQSVGAPAGLAAIIVGVSGLLGGILAPLLLPRGWSEAARGVAMGVAAHGVGTAVALRLSFQTGAYAALGMMLNGLVTSLWLPIVWRYAAEWVSHTSFW